MIVRLPWLISSFSTAGNRLSLTQQLSKEDNTRISRTLSNFLNSTHGTTFDSHCRSLSYIQGQTHEKRREYFYYIDHHGQLFLDDARIKNFTSCFKDKEFLAFFFTRLKLNDTGNYENEFPYLSPCGRERNYVRCDDVPIVYTHFLGVEGGVDELQSMQREEQQLTPVTLSWGGAGDQLTTVFEPWRICMLPSTGRVYHPTTSTTTTLDATASTAPSPTSSPLSRPRKSSSREVRRTVEPSGDLPPLGLIKSSLAIDLSKYFEFEAGEDQPPTHFNWQGRRHTLTNELILMAEKYSKEETE